MLNLNSTVIPWYSAWAWWQPIQRTYSAATPIVFLGYQLAKIGGTIGMVLCDWVGAVFNLLTGVLLVFNKHFGIVLAATLFSMNVLILMGQTALILSGQNDAKRLEFIVAANLIYFIMGWFCYRVKGENR